MAVTLQELNLRGHIFHVELEALQKDSGSFLGTVVRGEKLLPRDGKGRPYINRNPALFHHILDYYNTGKLSFPSHFSWDIIKGELEFWRIDESALTTECASRYDSEKFLFKRGTELAADFDRYDYMSRGTSCPDWARRWRSVWEFVDIPQSSRPSMFYNVLMCGVLPLVSFFNMMLSVKVTEEGTPSFQYHTTFHRVVEVIILVLLTLEVILRFLVWPSKLRFLLDPLNWVDVLSTLVTWSGVFVKARAHMHITYVMFFTTFRFFRVFRIWRAYKPCKALILALRYSIKDFILTAFVFFLLEVLFAFWVFAIEVNISETETHVTDLVSALFWSVVTLSTVGYGDIIPQSTFGKTVTGLCAGAALLMIILPVGIFTHNYASALKHLEAAQSYQRAMSRQGQTYRLSNIDRDMYQGSPDDVTAS